MSLFKVKFKFAILKCKEFSYLSQSATNVCRTSYVEHHILNNWVTEGIPSAYCGTAPDSQRKVNSLNQNQHLTNKIFQMHYAYLK